MKKGLLIFYIIGGILLIGAIKENWKKMDPLMIFSGAFIIGSILGMIILLKKMREE